MRKLIVIESPFAASETRSEQDNMDYLGECIWDSLFRGEAPMASHGLYPRWLDDRNLSLRKVGMECGTAWIEVAVKHVFYTDFGWSAGMLAAFRTTPYRDKIELRALYGDPVFPSDGDDYETNKSQVQWEDLQGTQGTQGTQGDLQNLLLRKQH